MTSRFDLAALVCLAALGCGRASSFPPCPEGFEQSLAGDCLCSSSAVCPAGFACLDGICRCDGDRCCPEGHHFLTATATLADRCVCEGDVCCPDGTRWDPAASACACSSDSCCPQGYGFLADANACGCHQDSCCPEGFAYDAMQDRCICAGDACCPQGYRFDDVGMGCTCADDSCCPAGHIYSQRAKGCVCVGVGCCPDGFESGPDGSCLCADDAACPGNLRCDRMNGRCICSSDADCPGESFCNGFGFCQSLLSCRGNQDCPVDHFCDSSSGHCLPDGSCGADLHCALGSICDGTTQRCNAGCRSTADCPFMDVCINGRCNAGRCEDSSYCPLRSFCDLSGETCEPPDPRYCQPCDTGCPGGVCLTTIIEGQGFMFCGLPCMGPADCPGEMTCDDSYSRCFGGGGCDANLICVETEVLNMGRESYCSDPITRRPAITGRFCAPRERMCN